MFLKVQNSAPENPQKPAESGLTVLKQFFNT